MDVMGWSNAAVVKRYAHVTAGLRGTSPTGSTCSCGRRMRLATHEADSKGSSARGAAGQRWWSGAGSNRRPSAFRIKDHRPGLAMMVSWPAQQAVVHADGLWCTRMYETTNETEPSLGPGGNRADP
jgi:hypothetical protein